MATLKLNSQTVVTESSGTLTAPALNITTGTISGTVDGTVSASATIADGVTYANKPICVWAGWNTDSNTVSSSWQNMPLDLDVVAVNTTYMTKSTNTFTVVKAGTYQVNMTTMANIDYGEYAHMRMMKNGSNHFISTHDYGSSSTDKWTGHNFSVMIVLAVNDSINFTGYKNGGGYTWHGGPSYSQLNIIYMYT